MKEFIVQFIFQWGFIFTVLFMAFILGGGISKGGDK